MYERIGYYLNPDDAVCTDDAPAGFADDNFSSWSGFRGWESPAVIFDHEESDSPTHCSVCGTLIPHALTPDGYASIMETITSDLADGTGRPEIYGQWWDEYGQNLDESNLREIISEAIEARRKPSA